jgi:PPOX class probable F420-dependent enzyme
MLDRARELGAREDGLAVVATTRPDGSVPASVVNAGVLDHPVTGEPVVGFVIRGGARKLTNLRAQPRVTVVFRAGREWVAVEGDVDLAGPDDPLEGVDPGRVLPLLREVYAAAVGGTADDWAGMDAEMEAERHTAALVRPARIYSNPG